MRFRSGWHGCSSVLSDKLLAERKVLLHEQLTRVGQLLKDNALPDVRIDKNKVRITPLDAEIPEGVEELARKAYAKPTSPINWTPIAPRSSPARRMKRPT